MKINVVQKQTQGDRNYQEDTLGQRDLGRYKLLVLADGMGGYAGGEIASNIVVDTFMRYPFFENRDHFLEEALFLANNKIQKYKELHPEVSNMGTTLIALLIDEKSYRWISVGDSPLYLIQNNKIKRINENHSVAGMLNLQVERGEISESESKQNKNRHLLTSAILGEEISMIDISSVDNFNIDDKLILASDGIETLSENDILNFINTSSSALLASQKILEEIDNRKKKNQDNASIIIVTSLVKKVEESRYIVDNKNIIIKIFLFFIFILFLLWK